MWLSQMTPFYSDFDSKHVLKQPCLLYSGMTYSGSLHGSTHLAVRALVDLSPYPWRQINKDDLE